MKQRADVVFLVLALAGGAIAGYLDQHTDDTGIIAVVILGLAFVLGAARPRLAWLWALLVGLAIPLAGAVALWRATPALWPGSVPQSLLALVFTFAGAYAGALTRRALTEASQS